MAPLTITIKPKTNRNKKFLVSLMKAERDFKESRVKKIRSLKELKN